MRRVLFHVKGWPVYSYPAMLYLGLVIGVYSGQAAAHAIGLNGPRVFAATLLLLIPALIGARLLFVAVHWDLYSAERRRIWDRSEGGMAMYGGLPLMVILSLPLLQLLSLPLGAFWDAATFTILSGMILTRVGCLLNGCCAGRPSASWFALPLADHQGVWCTRIPTPLCEAAWGAVLLIGAWWLLGRLPFHGALFAYAVAGYGAGRLVLERTREHKSPSDMRVQSAISMLCVLGGTLALTIGWPL